MVTGDVLHPASSVNSNKAQVIRKDVFICASIFYIYKENTIYGIFIFHKPKDGLLPKNLAQGKVFSQFRLLSEKAGIKEKVYNDILNTMLNQTDLVEKLTFRSFLDEKTQRYFFQSYQTRLNKLKKE